ncbi:MAG TPA: bifunctional transaldolase/phosoglucose isomerase [Candidatus Omnitrophota bacterium]|nr:bifunctional transaldolase/phosoglucose isomerase [Candidatus Omnitrophota bacterium]HPS36876.1 bifunctional transaldolase/phosoglucose isomerase [Candidatus Omnitrophota bacterium]
MTTLPSVELYNAGQGPWLDTISRKLLKSGTLKSYVEESGLLGVTSNPSIFQQAIGQGEGYEQDIRKLSQKGASTLEIYDALTLADIRQTCDLFLPVFERTNGEHGFVSLEVLPCLAFDEEATVAEARRLFKAVAKPNVMIKVPATPQGVRAVERLIGEGININVTLIFSQQNYRDVAYAYLAGLEAFAKKGGDLRRVHSVASVFVSRIDTDIDKQLDAKIASENDPQKKTWLAGLKGKAAIANSKMIYQEFKKIFATSQAQDLKSQGAYVQKTLWGSTSTKNPAYQDLIYVETLVGKNTVNTLPQATWEALLHHGQVRPDTVEENVPEAQKSIEDLKSAGIDVHVVCDRLQKDGVKAFVNSFESLMATIEAKRGSFKPAAPAVKTGISLPEKLQKAVQDVKTQASKKDLHARWLAKDPTLWSTDEGHKKVILNRLGWVANCEKISGRLYEVDVLCEKLFKEKIRDIVLLGMGGSSLAAEVLSLILTKPTQKVKGALKGVRFHLLDTTDPASILKVEKAVRYPKTVFLVGSKSGSTIETRSQYQYFFDRLTKFYKGDANKAAERMVIVTDEGSPMADLGRSKPFCGLFLNPGDIGGRYSALSFFGLVPAALLGIDIRKILGDAQRFLTVMRQEKDLVKNEGIALGLLLGALALKGKDKLTFWTSPELASFADWAEQLIAESTGKEGKGITPIANEAPLPLDRYGADRVFAILRLKGESEKLWKIRIKDLKDRGFAVLDFVWADGTNVGGEFLRWEVATSFASVVLKVNPFDEPNVTESKNITSRLLEDIKKKKALPVPKQLVTVKSPKLSPADQKLIAAFLKKLPADGFVSLLAYVDRSPAAQKALRGLQKSMAAALKVPVLSGFGPRYLHSIGQLYKGGPKQGIFIEFFVKDAKDVRIPGEVYGFSQLKQAQALGDYEAISSKGLPVLGVELGRDPVAGLSAFAKKLSAYFERV